MQSVETPPGTEQCQFHLEDLRCQLKAGHPGVHEFHSTLLAARWTGDQPPGHLARD